MKIQHYDPRRLELSKHCFVHKGRLAEFLSTQVYNRQGILKVFDLLSIKDKDDIENIKWGDDPKPGQPRKNTTLIEATQIQNILSWYELSSPVYGLTGVSLCENIYPAQFIKEEKGVKVNDDEVQRILNKCIDIGKHYNFSLESRKVSQDDVINGRLIDPQMFAFNKPYKDTVKDIYINNKYGERYYQDIEELGLSEGARRSKQREIDLGLDKIDFSNKNVLDVGCSGGYFTRVAIDRGAALADGIDFLDQVEVARNVANLLGYWNNQYYAIDLTKGSWNIASYDIVFFLSLNFHIDIPKSVLEAPMVIFEDNGKETRHNEKLGKPWTDHFSKIEYIGRATDHGDKAIYHLYK